MREAFADINDAVEQFEVLANRLPGGHPLKGRILEVLGLIRRDVMRLGEPDRFDLEDFHHETLSASFVDV